MKYQDYLCKLHSNFDYPLRNEVCRCNNNSCTQIDVEEPRKKTFLIENAASFNKLPNNHLPYSYSFFWFLFTYYFSIFLSFFAKPFFRNILNVWKGTWKSVYVKLTNRLKGTSYTYFLIM